MTSVAVMAGLLRGHEAHVGQCRCPTKQGRLLRCSGDLVVAFDVIRNGLWHTARFQGDDTETMRSEFDCPLPTKPSTASRAILKPSISGGASGFEPPNIKTTPDLRSIICRAAALVVRTASASRS
ncbi:hypothetical protein [Halocatena pleomorpha]|uniref:hypothetical protein n=1 Tax=Halocatena pleomorpha TaxID=1785090 RepID=UPI001C8AE249|nr:hypothetical protein [Halocatena pleomorpha]